MDEQLSAKFPEMKPVKGSPTLFTLNGCGLSIYGKRNFDAETGTYIATRFITLVFVPLFAVSSYRVADAEEGGWYFLGKEGVSKVWQMLNAVVLSLLIYAVGMISWSSYTSSPDYRQKKALEMVDQREKGAVMKSIVSLVDLHDIGGGKDREVEAKFQELALEGVSAGPWKEAKQVLNFVSSNRYFFDKLDGFDDDLSKTADKRLTEAVSGEHAQAQQLASQLIGMMSSLKHQSVDQFRKQDRAFLETLVADPSVDIQYATRLAEYCEAEGDKERCKGLLEPRIKDLADTEGARILGQIFVSEGQHSAAYPLLEGYVLPRLEKLKKASESFDKAADKSYDKTIKFLNDGQAPESFYTRYDKASEEDQSKMVNEIVVKRMDNDSNYKSALRVLREAGLVVPVAMDFGVMQLRRAQGLSDEAEKKELLQGAEKTFLALQSVASDDEDYQLSLGQVYFWMGRMNEGEELFASARKSSGDSVGMLYDQGTIYRELGDERKGLELLKQAHAKSKDKEDSYEIAKTIATMCDDAEEEIEWLKRCNQEDLSVKIGVSNAEGKLAYSKGDYTKALKHFERAHEDYKQMQDSAVTFNNHSLVLQYLYAITGKPVYYRQSVELMHEAVKLSPNNSILLGNAASQAFTSATIDLVSEKFSPEFVKEMSDRGALRLLYGNADERDAMRSKFLAQDSAKRAFQYLGSLQILSPKSDWIYSTGERWFWMMGMEGEAAASYKQVATIEWEPDDDWKTKQQELLDGKSDQEFIDSFARAKKYDIRVRKSITNDGEWLLYQCSRISQQIGAEIYGVEVDYASLLEQAEQASEKYPCSYTSIVHRDVLLAKGLHHLAQSQAGVQKLMKSYGRLLSSNGMLMILLQHDDASLTKAILANSDIEAYLRLKHQEALNFPKSITKSERFLCSLLGDNVKMPDPAESAAYIALREEGAKASLLRYSRSVSVVMHYYWILKMNGKDAAAKKVYDDAVKEGVGLPPLD